MHIIVCQSVQAWMQLMSSYLIIPQVICGLWHAVVLESHDEPPQESVSCTCGVQNPGHMRSLHLNKLKFPKHLKPPHQQHAATYVAVVGYDASFTSIGDGHQLGSTLPNQLLCQLSQWQSTKCQHFLPCVYQLGRVGSRPLKTSSIIRRKQKYSLANEPI